MKHNEDSQCKLLKAQEEAHRIGTVSTLTRDQQDLLRIHETCNHAISAAGMQTLAAIGVSTK